MSVTTADANTYFATRLHSDAWDSASDATRQKALATAERQIGTLPLAPDVPGEALTAAICEQAIWLLELTSYDRERARAQALGVIGGSVGDANEYSSAEIVRGRMAGIQIAPAACSLLAGYILRSGAIV